MRQSTRKRCAAWVTACSLTHPAKPKTAQAAFMRLSSQKRPATRINTACKHSWHSCVLEHPPNNPHHAPHPSFPRRRESTLCAWVGMDSHLRGNDDVEALKPLPNPQPFLLFFCVLCATSAPSASYPRIPASCVNPPANVAPRGLRLAA